MWSPMLTLNPIVLEDTRLGSSYLVKAESDFIKIFYLIILSSITMGFWVTMVGHMCLCAVRGRGRCGPQC